MPLTKRNWRNYVKANPPSVASTSTAYAFGSSDAEAWINAITATPSTDVIAIIDQFQQDMDASNLWAKIDWLLIEGMGDIQANMVNAVDPSQSAVAVNSPTAVAYNYTAGNGTNSYVRIPEALNAMTHYTQSSGHVAIFAKVPATGAGYRAMMGARDSTAGSTARVEIARNAAGNRHYSINQSSAGDFSPGSSTGLLLANRGSSDAVSFWEGASSANTFSTGSLAAPPLQPYVHAFNLADSPTAYSAYRGFSISIGGGLTSSEIADYSTHIANLSSALAAFAT